MDFGREPVLSTILELNCDSLVGAFHEEPVFKSSSQPGGSRMSLEVWSSA